MALSKENIQFWAATDVGRKRKHNEDNFLIDREVGLYVVADGMGGHAAGEVASAIAVRTIHEVVCSRRDLLDDIEGPSSEVSARPLLSLMDNAIQTASARINAEAQADPEKRGMGTTVSCLLVRGPNAYIAHVGDSRIYMSRHGHLHQVTEDHTVANELLRLGMVTPDQLANIPRKNAITRAVGVYQTAEVDTLNFELLPSDVFLLCSDGLSGYFDKGDGDLLPFLQWEGSGNQVVQSLIDFANKCGGKDNITAVMLRLGGGDTTDSVRAKRLALKREVLAAMPLFSRLNERELLRVMQVADAKEFKPGEIVVRAGEPGDAMYVALSGKLSVEDGPTQLMQLGPGDQFGEMALIRSTPRSATVRAIDPSELIELRRQDFFDIIRSEPHVSVKLLWQFLNVLADRLERTSRDLTVAREELSAEDISVAAVLEAESQAAPPSVSEEDPFARPATDQTLGGLKMAYAGLVPPDPDAPDPSDAVPIDITPGEWAQRIDDSPSFDDAPAIAERISQPPPAPKPPAHSSPPAAGAPHSFNAILDDPAKLMEMARRIDEQEAKDGVPFDARSTRPGRSRRRARAPTLSSLSDYAPKRPRREATPRQDPETAALQAADAKGAGAPHRDVPFDKKITLIEEDIPDLPGEPPPLPRNYDRERTSTLPSEGARASSPPPRPSSSRGAKRRRRPVVGPGERMPSDRNTLRYGDGEQPHDAPAPPSDEPVEDDLRTQKETVPLNPEGTLKSELEVLRKEFQERLRKSREARKSRSRNDSD